MKRLVVASIFSLACLVNQGSANAADFFYEKFADQVVSVYGAGWSVFLPFAGLPAATDDPSRQGQTYPGQLWNFSASPGARRRGQILEHAEMYCPGQNIPKPLDVSAATFRDVQDLTQFGITGEISVGQVLKITAIDAQYLKSVTATGSNVRRMYLPGATVLKNTVRDSVRACGSNFFYAITSVLYGKITINAAFDRKLDFGVAATIANTIAVNLGVKARVVRCGTADKVCVIQTEEPAIFAVKAVPVSSLR